MNKQDWTYKKLGEVCDIICGQDYKKVESPNGKYPIYGTGGIMGYANQFRCPAHSVIIGRKGSINNPLYIEEDFWNVDTAFGIVPSPSSLLSKYFYYFCKSYDFTKHNVAVTIPSLRRIDLLKIPILIPPIGEQERIVEELDLLSGIIDKKKEQLKAYDQLAQSIFYTMFGDPVTNEKGWEVIRLGSRCEVSSFKRVLIEEVVDKGIPFIRGTELMSLSKGENTPFTLFITPEHYEKVKAISGVPKIGDLLIPSINANGSIWVLNTEEPRYYKDGRVLWVHVDKNTYTSQALKYIMHILIMSNYSSVASGATFAELKLFVLRDLNTILPPLSLQEEFAEKVESIERQKALIRQSIDEVQTMFDYTMDKYFG